MVKHLLRVNCTCLAMVLSLMFLGLQSVWADGSKDMYPSDYYSRYGVTAGSAGDYRACLMSGITSSGSDPDLAAPFPTYGTIKVYAKAGEHIYLASSAMTVKNKNTKASYGRIDWRSPDGTSGSVDNVRKGGLIENRAQELAGPNINGATAGYDAYVITVGAEQEGVWEIDFIGATTTLNFSTETPSDHRVNDWKENTNLPYINAFDVSVTNEADNAFIPGRVYANVLNLLMPSNYGGASYACEWYSTLYVLTNTGYLYEVKPNGQNGHFSTFFANNKGVQKDPAGWVTDNSDFSTSKGLGCYGGLPLYASFASELDGNQFKNYRIPTFDPRRPDEKSSRMVDGEEVVTDDITHKIFFTKPAKDLPASARAVYGKKVVETWLLTDSNAKDTPTLTNMSLVGKESHLPGVLGPEGVDIYFEANASGDYSLEMTFGEGFTNRTFSGVCVKGENVIEWDGLDGDGKRVDVVNVVLAGKLKAAEIHFPFFDLENNKHGLILNQLTADWSAVERDTVYWDDSNVSNTKGANEDVLVMTTGAKSPAHIWYNSESNRGNNRIVDTWTFAQGASIQTQTLTASTHYVDLAVNSISCDTTKVRVGESISYIMEIENRAAGLVTFNGEKVMVDADVDSASFGVWFAAGGFYTTAVELVESDDPTCVVKHQPSDDEFGLGFISLKNGKRATVRVTGYLSAVWAHAKVQPKGFVMRPGDFFEIDANNIASDGMPLNPSLEYEGRTQNNMMLAPTPLLVLNSAPETVADDAVVPAGQTVEGNLLTNDSDVDKDHLKVVGYSILGVEGTMETATPVYDAASVLCGSLVVKGDGSYAFSASGDFNGMVPDIYYAVSDQYEGTGVITTEDLIPGRDTSKLAIQVLPNHQPVVTPTEVLVHRVGDKTLLPLTITDEDGDDLTITLAGENKELFAVEGDSIYYVGGSVASLTTYQLGVTVNDGVTTPVTANITVKVRDNRVPTLSPGEVRINASRRTVGNYLLPVKITDPDGDKVMSVVVAGNANFSVSDGYIYFKATNANTNSTGERTYNITVTLTDELGGVSEAIPLKVVVNVINGTIQASNAYAVADDIHYGDPLISAFTRGADVEGEWLMKRSSLVYYEDDAILPVGSYSFDLLFDPNDDSYRAEEVKGVTFKVLPREITLQSDSAKKVYDGTALTAPVVKVVAGSLVGEDQLLFSNFSTLTNVDTVENDFSYGAAAGTSLDNYKVTLRKGALMVTPLPVTITSGSDTKVYDGTPLMKEAVSVTASIPVDETLFNYTHFASQTEVGSVDNTFEVLPATGVELSNYDITRNFGTLTVTKRIIEGYTIKLSSTSYKYDGTAHEPAVTVSLGGEILDPSLYTVTYKNNVNFTNEARVVVEGVANANYEWKSDSTKFSISKRRVRFKSGSCEKDYDGLPLVCESLYSITGDDIVEGDVYTVNYTGTITNVGSAINTMVVSFGEKQDNYLIFTEYGTLTVKKNEFTLKESDITLSDASFVYDKQPHCPTMTILVDGKALLAQDVDYTLSCSNNVNVGTADVTIHPVADGNCSFTEFTTHFEITPATVRVTDKSVDSKVYDGTKSATITLNTIEGVYPGDDVNVTATASFDDANAGEHKDVNISYALTGSDNYQLEFETETYTEGVITPKEVTVAWDEPTSFVYDGTPKSVTATVVGALDGETVNVVAYTGDQNVVNVGHYATAASALDDSNYQLAAGSALNWEITKITDKPVITLSDEPFVYDQTVHEPSVTVKVKGVAVDPSDYSVVYKNNVNAGDTAMVIVSPVAGDDHVYDFKVDTAYFSIAKRALSYTSPSDEKVFDGTPLVKKSCVADDESQILTGDVPTILFTGSQTNVGSSDNTFTVTFEPDNYAISYHYGTLTVTPKPVVLENTSVVWNDTVFIYDGQEHCPTSTITVDGLEMVPDVDYAVFCVNNVNVGSEVAQIAIRSVDGGNFVFTDYEVNFSILPRTIYVKDSVVEEKKYDGDNVATVTVSEIGNLVVGEDVQINATAQFDDEKAGTDKVVTIQYSLSGSGAGNYLLAYESATYDKGVISPREVQLTWSEDSLVYSGAKLGVSATVSTDLPGVELKVVDYVGDSALAAGNYTAKALSLNDANFKLPDEASLPWRIYPKVLTPDMFALKDSVFDYDAQPHDAEFVLDEGIQLEEYTDYTVTYLLDGSFTWSYFPPVNAGKYAINIILSNPNYTFEGEGNWSLLINKAVITPDYTLVDTKRYDQNSEATVTVNSFTGVLGAEDVNVTATARYDTSSVDASAITVRFALEGADIMNYEMASDSVEVAGTITPIALKVVGTAAADKEYDATTVATVTPGALNGGILGLDEVDFVVASADFAAANVGDNIAVYVKYTLTGKDAGNYEVKDDTLSANILAPVAVPSWSVADDTYGNVKVGVNPSVEMVPALAGTITYQVDGVSVVEGFLLPAGDHEVSALFTTEKGLDINCGSQTIHVSQRVVTLNSLLINNTKKYDGTDTLSSITTDSIFAGVVEGDQLILDSYQARYDGVTVSDSREIKVSFLLSGADVANYTIEPVLMTGAILPREVELTAAEDEKVYDGTPLALDKVTISGDGFVSGDVANLHATGAIVEPGEAENVVELTWSSLEIADNYTVTLVNGKLTVLKISQDAPEITPVAESLSGYADGKMIGLTAEMVLRAESESDYQAVTNPDPLFAPGTYYVKLPETAHYYASDSVAVVILPGVSDFSVLASVAQEKRGTTMGSGSYPHHSDVTIEAVANEGYHFVAWNDSITTNPYEFQLTEDTAFIATFAPNQYVLTLMSFGSVMKKLDVLYGEKVTEATLDTVPERIGYTFMGWDTVFPLTIGAGDVTLSALWEKKTYHISFEGEHGIVDAQFTNPVPFGTTIRMTPVADEGYHFDAWADGVVSDTRYLTVTKDTVIKVSFLPNEYVVTVKNGENVLKQVNVTFGDEVTEATLDLMPEREGYEFAGWKPTLPFTMRSHDTIVEAQWEKIRYQVTVLAENGAVAPYTNPVAFEEFVDLTLAPLSGYHFVAWKDGVAENPRSVQVVKDTVLEAIFAPNSYTITALDGTDTLKQVTALYGATVTESALDLMPEREGYDFVGWTPALPLLMDAKDTSIMAQWRKQNYLVTLDTVGIAGSVVADFVNPIPYGESISLAAFSAVGHHFVAWNDGEASAERKVVVTQDTTLSPIFERDQVELLFKDRGEVVLRMPLLYGDTVKNNMVRLNLEREGYDFVGWEPSLPIVVREESASVEAQWRLKQIELTMTTEFEHGNVTIDSENPITYGDTVTLTVQPEEGYHFVSWSDGDTTNPRRVEVVSDTVLTPYFDRNQYELALVVEGDTFATIPALYGDTITADILGALPEKEGYDFLGWMPELPYVIGAENVSLEAQWQIKSYEIKMDTIFEHGEMEISLMEPVNYGDKITLTAVPAEGYHFQSWSDGSVVNPREVVVKGDTSFVPLFALNSYTFMVMNEADTMKIFTFYYGDTVRHEILDQLNPAKVGHDFIGWDATLPIFMPAHDTVIHAQYIPKVYTVVAKINGNVGKVTGEGDYDYGTVVEMNAIPNRGYHFVSWGDGDTAQTVHFAISCDTIVSALFAKDVDEMMVDSIIVPIAGYCPGTEDVMRYTLLTSEAPTEYRILYSDEAKAVGFEDVDFTSILADNEIRVVVPNAPAKTYKAQVQFRNASNSLTPLFDVNLVVNLSNDYIIDIWADVVSAVNLESRFVEYQWYHNDVKVGGANAPYYCEKNGLTGNYYMEVVTVEGEHMRTCKKWFDNSDNTTLSVYPNPTQGVTTIELSVDNGDTHNLVITNVQGVAVYTGTFEGRKTQVDFGRYATGAYVVDVDGLTVKTLRK